MSSPLDATTSLSPLNAPVGTSSPEAERAKIQALAQQFESLLLAQMMREMKQAMAPESDDEQGLGGSIMADTFTSELGLALSRAGGVGLSKVLIDGFTKNLPANVASQVTDPGGDSRETVGRLWGDSRETVGRQQGLGPMMPVSGPLSRAVSSEFGWRTDPIDGRHKFHAGTDLRLAYGQEVRAAAGGSVTFAGEQGGYGTTVIVRHGDGLETRYAHLSSLDVRVGDEVAAGQVIARSGNTGRTTGPHLHFEVRQHGRPVDPEAVEGLASLDALGGEAGH